MTPSAEKYLERNYANILDRLIEFASIASISTEESYQAEVRRAADWVAGKMKAAGLENISIFQTPCHPIVYGEWLGKPGKPTILVYGHYDVQPADPVEEWLTAPFQPTVKHNRIYGRGVSDDKGPLLIPMEVCEALIRTEGALPVNVKFLVEGEEEIGSPSIKEFLQKHTELLACDMVLSADGAMWRPDFPSINTASRGMTTLAFSIQGPAHDVHSGRYGGAVPNPLHAISRLVASLHNPDGSIAIEGFYDHVEPIDEEELAEIKQFDFNEQHIVEDTGVIDAAGETGYSLLERLWFRPTLDLVGLWGGHQGSGFKAAIPSSAHAKITCRLVPGQNPLDIRNKIKQHLHTHLPSGVKLTIHPGEPGVPAYCIPRNHIGLQIAGQALQLVTQQKPKFVRIGATLPISTAFKEYLGADTIFFSFSTSDEGFHGPNEFLRLNRFREGLQAYMHFFTLLSQIKLSPFNQENL